MTDPTKPKTVWSRKTYIKKLTRNLLIGFSILVFSLLLGMIGYHHYEKMSWIDAYLNAAMILSGMGPVGQLQSVAGKIFAGSYALFSGIIFLVAMAIVLAPSLHHFFHKFHLEENMKD